MKNENYEAEYECGDSEFDPIGRVHFAFGCGNYDSEDEQRCGDGNDCACDGDADSTVFGYTHFADNRVGNKGVRGVHTGKESGASEVHVEEPHASDDAK
jgi:hypothetical protein